MWNYDDFAAFGALGSADHQRRQPVRNFDPLSHYSSAEFRERYRFSKECFNSSCNEFRTELDPVDKRNMPVDTNMQMLITLRFLATGSFQITDGDHFNVHQTTAGRIVHRVARCISKRSARYIRFPSTEEQEDEKKKFYMIKSFPGVIGVIDGTHIPIQRPADLTSSELYRNRKGFYSLNVQLKKKKKMRIRNIVSHWYDSANDSRIFQNSSLYDNMAELPSGSWLLGDSGYPCLPFLLTPFLSVPTRPRKLYNASHISTRNVVERGIGLWKRRFPAMHTGLRVDIQNCQPIVVASAVLHNIAINNREEMFEEADNFEVEVPLMEFTSDNGSNGNAVRESVVERYFSV